jgi:HEPN domain-containing protein
VTGEERADRLIREARQVAGEMKRALDDGSWNLATRRAQESLALAMAALLTEMCVDFPKTHDPVPGVREAMRRLRLGVDASALDSLETLSRELTSISSLAFNQDIVVTDAQALDWGQRGDRALQFAENLLGRVRNSG